MILSVHLKLIGYCVSVILQQKIISKSANNIMNRYCWNEVELYSSEISDRKWGNI